MIARHVMIEGLVQGVFFRASTRKEARRLGVGGWVKNLPDGRVEGFFQGERLGVEALVEWCRTGPPMATVEKVEVANVEPRDGLNRFELHY